MVSVTVISSVPLVTFPVTGSRAVGFEDENVVLEPFGKLKSRSFLITFPSSTSPFTMLRLVIASASNAGSNSVGKPASYIRKLSIETPVTFATNLTLLRSTISERVIQPECANIPFAHTQKRFLFVSIIVLKLVATAPTVQEICCG